MVKKRALPYVLSILLAVLLLFQVGWICTRQSVDTEEEAIRIAERYLKGNRRVIFDEIRNVWIVTGVGSSPGLMLGYYRTVFIRQRDGHIIQKMNLSILR